MAGNWTAGLKDLDEQGVGPSAASPLAAAGLDPDLVRANLGLQAESNSDTPSGRAAKPAGPMAAQPMGSPEPVQSVNPGASVGSGGSAPAPPPSSVDTPYAEAMGGLQNLGRMETVANKATEDIQTTDPTLTALQQRRSQLAQQPDLYDPQTGKMKDKVQVFNPQTGQMEDVAPKPSKGQRIWRGVRGGLVGLLTGGIPGAAVGALEPQDITGGEAYGAPNKAYQRDMERNEAALGATDAGMKNEFETWKAMVDAQKEKSTQLRSNATIDKDRVEGAKGLIDAQANQTKAENESPEGKARAEVMLSRQEYVNRQAQLESFEQRTGKLPPATEASYMLTGKIPDPKQPHEPSAEEVELAQARQAFTKQNGRAPNYDEYIKLVQGLRGREKSTEATPQQLRSIQDAKASGIAKANEDYSKASNLRDRSARQNYQRDLQAVQDKFEEDAATFGVAGQHYVVTVDDKGNPKWTPEAQPAAAAAQPSGLPPSGVPVPEGGWHQVMSKADNKLHWTDSKASKDYGVIQ